MFICEGKHTCKMAQSTASTNHHHSVSGFDVTIFDGLVTISLVIVQ